jgi:hypothetical protein
MSTSSPSTLKPTGLFLEELSLTDCSANHTVAAPDVETRSDHESGRLVIWFLDLRAAPSGLHLAAAGARSLD